MNDVKDMVDFIGNKKKLVLGFFADKAAAEAAAESLRAWDDLDDDVKLHGVGVLALEEDGSLSDSSLGKARAAGAATGFGGWLLVGMLAGPIGPVLALPIIGGVFGAIYHPGFGLSTHERDRIAAELGSGKAAVSVFVKHDEEALAVSAKLAELRGEPETHNVSDEVKAAAVKAAASVANAPSSS